MLAFDFFQPISYVDTITKYGKKLIPFKLPTYLHVLIDCAKVLSIGHMQFPPCHRRLCMQGKRMSNAQRKGHERVPIIYDLDTGSPTFQAVRLYRLGY